MKHRIRGSDVDGRTDRNTKSRSPGTYETGRRLKLTRDTSTSRNHNRALPDAGANQMWDV